MPEAVPAFVWVERLAGPGGRIDLDESAAHHVVRVCRARVGDSLAVTDGRGALARCRVGRIQPSVTLEVERVDRSERARTGVLLCGAPEGQRFDWVVEKLAELGVARVRPIHTERARWSSAAVRPERWRRLAVAALEQSRGRFLLDVEEPAELREAVAAEGHPEVGILAEAEGGSPAKVAPAASGSTVALVGPAEGLSDEEKEWARGSGFVAMSLASSRLRTETAAVAWASWWASPR